MVSSRAMCEIYLNYNGPTIMGHCLTRAEVYVTYTTEENMLGLHLKFVITLLSRILTVFVMQNFELAESYTIS